MSNQYTYNYQQVPPDLEANKAPPYTSQYVYGAQPAPMAPPPPQYGWVNDGAEQGPVLSPVNDIGISSFSEKSVRQGSFNKFQLHTLK